MLLHERLTARRRPVNLKILATDVHKASLEVASAGIYTEEQVAGISPERLERFFTLQARTATRSRRPCARCIVFAPHNLIRDAPFTKLDLITCRNLLIYFQPHAQKTVLTLFHFALKPGGFLFLGSSESPGGLLDEFDTDRRARQDLPQAARHRAAARPEAAAAARRRGARADARRRGRAARVNPQLLAIYDRLLDRFMPPSFLVDEHGQLVDTLRRRRGAAQGQGAAAVAEPARDARRRAADGRVAARCTACGATPRRVRYAGLSIAGDWPAATRSSPSRCATRTAR